MAGKGGTTLELDADDQVQQDQAAGLAEYKRLIDEGMAAADRIVLEAKATAERLESEARDRAREFLEATGDQSVGISLKGVAEGLDSFGVLLTQEITEDGRRMPHAFGMEVAPDAFTAVRRIEFEHDTGYQHQTIMERVVAAGQFLSRWEMLGAEFQNLPPFKQGEVAITVGVRIHRFEPDK